MQIAQLVVVVSVAVRGPAAAPARRSVHDYVLVISVTPCHVVSLAVTPGRARAEVTAAVAARVEGCCVTRLRRGTFESVGSEQVR